ncbi:hypothetical protein D3C79_647110 [compost metagenome]
MAGRVWQAGQQLRWHHRQPALGLVNQGEHEQVLPVPGPQTIVGRRARQFDAGFGKVRKQLHAERRRHQVGRLDQRGQLGQGGGRVAAHPPQPVAGYRQAAAFAEHFGQLRLWRRAVDEGGQGQGQR